MKRTLLLLTIIAFTITAKAQQNVWTHCSNSETESTLATDEEGNLYTLSLITSSLLSIDEAITSFQIRQMPATWIGKNYVLTKTSPSGTVLWNRNISATSSNPTIHGVDGTQVYVNNNEVYIGFSYENANSNDTLKIISPTKTNGDHTETFAELTQDFSVLVKLDDEGYYSWSHMFDYRESSLGADISKIAFLESSIQVNLSAPHLTYSTIIKLNYNGTITDTIPDTDYGIIYDIAELNNSSSYIYLTEQDMGSNPPISTIHKFDVNDNMIAEFSTNDISGLEGRNKLIPEAATIDANNNIYVIFKCNIDFGKTATYMGNEFVRDSRMLLKLDSNLNAKSATCIVTKYTGTDFFYSPNSSIGISNNSIFVALSTTGKNTDLFVNGNLMNSNATNHFITFNPNNQIVNLTYSLPNYLHFKIASSKTSNSMLYFIGEAKDSVNLNGNIKKFSGQTRFVFGRLLNKYNQIKGDIVVDLNKNNTKDVNETNVRNARLVINNQVWLSGNDGKYNHGVDSGKYVIKVLPPKYFETVPDSITIIFNEYDSAVTNNFYLQPTISVTDLDVHLTNQSGRTRVGRKNVYRITVNNNGTQTTSPTIRFVHDARMAFNSAGPPVDSTKDNQLFWNINNLKPLESRNITITLDVDEPPSANIDDTLCSFVEAYPIFGGSIETSDSTASDNRDTTYDIITGAYDPNIKETSRPEIINVANVNGSFPIDYTIHFQNTGNDTAFHVYLIDSLDADLKVESIEVLSASHDYQMSISENNTLRWDYYNILLVDSTTNEPMSHGFVKYRVWTKDNPGLGDEFTNFADIYFDFNEPVRTNTTSNRIDKIESVELVKGKTVIVYPNPSNGVFTVKADIKAGTNAKVEVMDLTGKLVSTQNVVADANGLETPIDINTLPQGIYFVKVYANNEVYTAKVIKQ